MSKSQLQFDFPGVPCPVEQFLDHVEQNPTVPIRQLAQPFLAWENSLRSVFAQDSGNTIIQNNLVNLINVFGNGNQGKIRIRGRKLDNESKEERERYIMPLEEEERKPDGQFAIASSLEDFQKNFNIFTENTFQSFDWSNIVAAGSAVTTCLAPVPEPYAGSVKSKREYYHQKVAPASDIDLFIYGIDDEQAAIDRMIAIEKDIRDNLISQTITVRTKNCVTITSQYPNRHVQIVLRLYKSISQILTGFDVNCSCVAYNGTSVFASPRALTAFMTQCNDMDLSRRSPTYESRLSKYSHRGFEVYCDFLDRSRIDPTIFERSFSRTVGLARLLVLERLPNSVDREEYGNKRRVERGGAPRRPWRRDQKNLKGELDDEIPEWQFEEAVSGYNTFTIPYGKAYNAKKIERMFYAKDILLNAEWNENNRPPIREVKLHRHPVFLGTVAEIAQDCCGHCPTPETNEEKAVSEEESKRYVSGRVVFLQDDPGRQEIGSFHPLDADDYTDMAYISDSEILFNAIVNNDVFKVKEWLAREDVNVNCRDHCGRMPLHVAAMSSDSLEIFQALIDGGARMIARLQDGRTALHIAAARGQNDFVNVLLRKSEANEDEKLEKEDKLRLAQRSLRNVQQVGVKEENPMDVVVSRSEEVEVSDLEDYAASEDCEKTSAGHSFVKVKGKEKEASDDSLAEENPEEPDILDVNALDWYFGMAPLHHAILVGSENQEVVLETLVSSFGADVLLPIKLKHNPGMDPKLILTLTLPFTLPTKDKVTSVLSTLLRIGASCAQANSVNNASALHYAVALNRAYPVRMSDISPAEVLDVILRVDGPAARGVMNNLASNAPDWCSKSTHANLVESPLMTAIALSDESAVLKLLQNGASSTTSYQDFLTLRGRKPLQRIGSFGSTEVTKDTWVCYIKQPLERAIRKTLDVIQPLLEAGADPSTVLNESYNDKDTNGANKRRTVLDLVRDNIKSLKLSSDNNLISEPIQLSEEVDASFYEQYPPGSYKRFYTQLRAKLYNKQLKANNLVKVENHTKKQQEREALKRDIDAAISYFECVEKHLISKGARSYYELYPEEAAKATIQEQPYVAQKEWKLEEKPWDGDFKFVISDLDDDKKEAYLKLFEATWSGDCETVKKLTINAYSDSSSEPLLVAAGDRPFHAANLNPFVIAVTRGHIELARIIFALAQVQYVPKNSTKKKYRYTLDEEGTGIVKEAIIEVSTVDNIGFQPHIVKSEISPLTMISASFMMGYEEGWPYKTLLSWAINNDQVDIIQTLLELARTAEDDGQWRLINPVLSYPINHSDNLCNAFRLGKTSILETFIKATGCGLDYAALETASHEKGTVKPEHYLGLTMNGRKRKDWAKSVNPNTESETATEKLLHIAAHQGNLDSVHWLLSDRPLHCLQEFIRLNPDNKRAKVLAAQPDLAKVVENAIGLDSEILAHLTIQGWNGKGSIAVLDFWFSKFPELLEARCDGGLTPLLHAVHCRNDRAIKYMIAKGADLQATTNDGLNFVHIAFGLKNDLSIYNPLNMEAVENAKRLLSCLPKDVDIKQMIAHRTFYKGELATIWHIFVDIKTFLPGVEYLLRISGGQGLDVFNGGGNLPIHHVITNGRSQLAKLYIEARPDLLHKENAGGKTPFELATDLFLGNIVKQTGEPVPPRYSDHQNDNLVEKFINPTGYHGSYYQQRINLPDAEEDGYDTVQDVFKTRKVLIEAVQKYQRVRVRVTLNEVNELVHRLANKGKQGKAKQAAGGARQRRAYRRRGEEDRMEGLLQAWPTLLGGSGDE